MKVELKLYKNFDADLLSLHIGGISITNLMRIALKGYVNNNTPNFYVPETQVFHLSGRKRFLHVSFEITDKKSVHFLKTEIKNRQRSAFLKSLLRGCMIAPNLGVYLKKTDTIEKETKRISSFNIKEIPNIIVIEYPDKSYTNTNKKIRIEEITPNSSYKQNHDLKEQKTNDTIVIDKQEDNETKKEEKEEDLFKEFEQSFYREEKQDSNDEDTISEEDLDNVDQDELMAQFLNLKE